MLRSYVIMTLLCSTLSIFYVTLSQCLPACLHACMVFLSQNLFSLYSATKYLRNGGPPAAVESLSPDGLNDIRRRLEVLVLEQGREYRPGIEKARAKVPQELAEAPLVPIVTPVPQADQPGRHCVHVVVEAAHAPPVLLQKCRRQRRAQIITSLSHLRPRANGVRRRRRGRR